jgi:hypothetical protein
VVVHICNPSNQEAEAGESPVGAKLGLRSKALSKKSKTCYILTELCIHHHMLITFLLSLKEDLHLVSVTC